MIMGCSSDTAMPEWNRGPGVPGLSIRGSIDRICWVLYLEAVGKRWRDIQAEAFAMGATVLMSLESAL
jgi:hypothetical protein